MVKYKWFIIFVSKYDFYLFTFFECKEFGLQLNVLTNGHFKSNLVLLQI